MALVGTGNALGDAMKAAIDGVGDKDDREAVFQAMGTAIIAHFLSNGMAAVTITAQPVVVASVTGVTTGPGVSGPGTGTVAGIGDLA